MGKEKLRYLRHLYLFTLCIVYFLHEGGRLSRAKAKIGCVREREEETNCR